MRTSYKCVTCGAKVQRKDTTAFKVPNPAAFRGANGWRPDRLEHRDCHWARFPGKKGRVYS